MNETDTAQNIVRHLERGVRELDPVIAGRLHEARFVALSRLPARELKLAPHGAPSLSASWGGHHPALRMGMILLLVALSIMGIRYWQQEQDGDDDNGQLDAKLLSSEIPPAAFAQKDFGAWLQETR